MHKKLYALLFVLNVIPCFLFGIEINQQTIEHHKKTFPEFVKEVYSASALCSYIPVCCTQFCNKVGSFFSEYDVDINELKKINDFFIHTKEQKAAIDQLNSRKNRRYLQKLFSYKQKNGNIRKQRKELEAAIRIESPKRMPDDSIRTAEYYECIACNLFAIHIIESEFAK